MSKKLSIASAVMTAVAAVMALLLLSVTPALAHHSEDHAQGGGNQSTTTSEEHGSDNTPGNDRKEGYEDNSDVPQEPNHGRGSDHDGDADADGSTAQEDDHTTSDAGDNAHPSGKDRSVENGGSGNQGRSESNPDDSKGPMRYETSTGQGDDKPGGPGGADRADQDGNNGCGNDDDFDDDNNGWCGRGRPTTPVKPADVNKPVCDADATMPGAQKCEKSDEVLGEVITKTCPNGSAMPANGNCGSKPNEVMPELDTNPSTPIEGVLGIRVSKAPAVAAAVQPAVAAQPAVKPGGAVLPFTGGDVLVLLAAALGLIAAGAVALKLRSTEA